MLVELKVLGTALAVNRTVPAGYLPKGCAISYKNGWLMEAPVMLLAGK
jgi:hypothetical protein